MCPREKMFGNHRVIWTKILIFVGLISANAFVAMKADSLLYYDYWDGEKKLCLPIERPEKKKLFLMIKDFFILKSHMIFMHPYGKEILILLFFFNTYIFFRLPI